MSAREARRARRAQREGDVLEHRQARVERVRLEHEGDASALRRQARDRRPVQHDSALGRRLEAGHDATERRFARAGGARHPEDLARPDVQVHVVSARVSAEDLAEPAELEATHPSLRPLARAPTRVPRPGAPSATRRHPPFQGRSRPSPHGQTRPIGPRSGSDDLTSSASAAARLDENDIASPGSRKNTAPVSAPARHRRPRAACARGGRRARRRAPARRPRRCRRHAAEARRPAVTGDGQRAAARRRVVREKVHRRLADELRDEEVRRMLVELVRRRQLLQDAGVHHGDAVGHRHGLGLVVGDQHAGDAGVLLEPLDLGAELHLVVAVEMAQRLVEEDDRRLPHQRAPDGDPLLRPAAELAHADVRQRVEPEERQHVVDRAPDLRPRAATDLQRERDVLGDREVRIERVVLEDHRDVALRGVERADRPVAEVDLARADVLDAGDHLQRRRLAAARRSEQRQQLAVGAGETQVPDGLDRPVALADSLEPDAGHALRAPSEDDARRYSTSSRRGRSVNRRPRPRRPGRRERSTAAPGKECPDERPSATARPSASRSSSARGAIVLPFTRCRPRPAPGVTTGAGRASRRALSRRR